MNLPRPPLLASSSSESVESVVAAVRNFPRPVWMELIRSDQSERWRAGVGVVAERYLELLPPLVDDQEDALVLICGEVRARRDASDDAGLEEYQSRFPDLADELAIQFELDETLGNLSTERNTRPDVDPQAFYLPGYSMLREIGRGSSSIVYLARQMSVDRLVAIKVTRAWSADANHFQRHRQEAAILSRMKHPNVVQIYDVIEFDGLLCSVLEYVDGKTLAEGAGNQPLPPREAAALVRTLAGTMHAVHEAGILHRDLKPSNVLINARGEAKVMDFGLARLLVGESQLTTHECLLGTPSYMPPELTAGDSRAGGAAGDIYSLGAILYELLTGRPPFLGVTILDTLTQIRQRDAVPPRALQPGTPRDLDTICLKCLAKAPADRYLTAADLADDLERFLNGAAIRARRPSWVEASMRWCRRSPLVAALSVGLLLTAVSGFAGVVWQWRAAEQASARESAAREVASERARELAQGLERLKLSNAFLDRGHRFIAERLWDSAEQDFSRAIELRPDHLQAWQSRAEFLYMRLGLFDLAAHDAARAFEIQAPNVGDRWLWHAMLRLEMNDAAGYRTVCRRMVQEKGRSVLLGYNRNVVELACLAPQEPELHRQMAEVADAIAPTCPQSSEWRYLQAATCLRAGRANDAIALCKTSLATQSTDFPLEMNLPILTLAYHAVGNDDEARATLDQAAAVMDRWIGVRCGDGADSWAVSQGAAGIWPVSCWHWLEFSLYLREARAALGDAAGADPRLHLLRARALAGLRRFGDAQREYALAVAEMPANQQVLLESLRTDANCLILAGKFDQAAEAFAQAGELSPDDCRLASYRALALAAAGQTGEYQAECEKILRRFGNSPASAVAHLVLDACLLLPNAVADSEQLIGIGRVASTDYVSAVRLLGAAQYRNGQFVEAVKSLQNAAEFDRPKPWDLAFLAMAHEGLGNHRDALAALASAEAWIDEATHPDPNDILGQRAAWGGWYERVHVPILLDEARRTIHGESVGL